MATRTGKTQEERRAETRTKLLEATISSLAENGLAATTSRRVCELAGVSQGAQTYHFPTRAELLGSAVEHLTERRIRELAELASTFPDEPGERLPLLLDLLWADFRSDTFVVFVKLWVAAHDDPELHARLVPVERRISKAILELSEETAGPELMRMPGWHARMTLVLSTLRGLALTEHFEPRGRPKRDPWPDMRATLLEMLGPI